LNPFLKFLRKKLKEEEKIEGSLRKKLKEEEKIEGSLRKKLKKEN